MPKMMMTMMGRGSEGKGRCGDTMSKMMKDGKPNGMTVMPDMMMEMMPHCLSMMLPEAPKEKRIDFVQKMVSIRAEKGCAGMSEEQKKELFVPLVERESA